MNALFMFAVFSFFVSCILCTKTLIVDLSDSFINKKGFESNWMLFVPSCLFFCVSVWLVKQRATEESPFMWLSAVALATSFVSVTVRAWFYAKTYLEHHETIVATMGAPKAEHPQTLTRIKKKVTVGNLGTEFTFDEGGKRQERTSSPVSVNLATSAEEIPVG